jgi:hypothetical protein
MKTGKKQGLKAEVAKGKLVISIGVDCLAYAIQNGDNWPEGLKITDNAKFAQDMLAFLELDEEDGSTVIHNVLDESANYAIEQGSEWIK